MKSSSHLPLIAYLAYHGLAMGLSASQIPADVRMRQAAETVRTNHVPGAAVVFLQGGKPDKTLCFGDRQVTPPLPVEPDTVFEAASLTKPIFAFAVLKRARELGLDLDQPLLSYLSGKYVHRDNPFKSEDGEAVTDARIARVTARMVLTHTSGLPNWSRGPVQFKFDPGAEWSYSSEGYVLLQRAVEKLAGESLDKFIEQAVFQPLAMTQSSLVWRDGFAKDFAVGYDRKAKPDHLGPYHEAIGSSTLYTTARDYGRFVARLLRDRPLLKTITAYPVSADPGLDMYWGLGWGIEKHGDDEYLFHWGSNPGFASFAMFSPTSGNGLIVLTNSDNGTRIFRAIASSVLGESHPIFRFRMLQPED